MSGVLAKSDAAGQLVAAVRAVDSGRFWFGGQSVRSVVGVIADLMSAAPAPRQFGLTTRERDIIALVVEGQSNREIAVRQRVGEERLDQLLFDWDGAFVDQDGFLRKTLSDRFGTSGREATPRVAPKHFLEWLQSPAADEMATTIAPAERADYLARVADARQALSRDIPTAAITKPVRGAEVAAAANAKLAVPGKRTRMSRLSHLERAPIEMDDQGRMFVSTRVPTSVKGQVKADAPLNTGLDEVLQDPELVRTFAAQIRGYNLLTDAQKNAQTSRWFARLSTPVLRISAT